MDSRENNEKQLEQIAYKGVAAAPQGVQRSVKKLFVYGNSIMSTSGFGTVARHILKRLTGEYQIFAQGIEHFVMPITYEGIYCLPTGRDEKTLGADAIAQYVDMIKPEYLITFTDLHTLAHVPTNERWIKCITIDCEPVSVQFRDVIQRGYINIVPNEFGKRALEEWGAPVVHIPFGADTKILQPKKSDAFPNIKDKFVFGCVGRNTERKRWDRLIRAFVEIHEECPDAVLLCYTDPREQFDYSINSEELATVLGVKDKVFFPKNVLMQRSVLTDENMANVYNRFDVHVNSAEREGFGLPILESMACGVPNIVVGYSAPPEIVGNAGIIINKFDWSYHSQYNYRGALVDVHELAEQMRILYDDKKLRTDLGKKARMRSLKYDWDKVIVPMWRELLSGVWMQEL